MEWGERRQYLLDVRADTGRTPPALLREANVPGDLTFVWDAFWQLDSDRPRGFGLGPIPRRSVLDAADRMGMIEDETEWFASLITAMDGVYLDWVAKQKPKP